MGNSHTKGQQKGRPLKQVHWKAADRPSAPGKPELVPGTESAHDVVTIRWARPRSEGGSPITGYLVEHRRTGSPHWVRSAPLPVAVPELTLSGLEPGWRYQFRVTAQNVVGLSAPGEVSEPLTVTLQRSVIAAPKFTEELHDRTALENEMTEFTVHVAGQPPPKLSWFKDGFEIFSSRRTRITTDNDKSVLTIHQVALSDEGEIKCTATNKAGHVSTKSIVKVEAPPKIRLPRQYEDGLLFELDEVIRLKVSIAGRPQPLVFWSHNSETIQSDDRFEITDTDRSSMLRIGEARRSDRGEYQIRAVNKLGEDATSFLVTVTDKPKPPSSLKVIMSLGKTVTLSWGVPDDDGGCKIGNYIVEYYRIGWNVWLKAATCRQLTTMLSDLIEGSEYKFRVKAESPYGVSDPSDETDVIFIPDPKRGMLAPPARSRSQPRVANKEPVPPKRRSTSTTRAANRDLAASLIALLTAPTPPKREKLKTPQKTPEHSPIVVRRDFTDGIPTNIFDPSSLARELAYGAPDIKYKKPDTHQQLQKPPDKHETGKRSPSPSKRDKSPSRLNQIFSSMLPKKSPSPTSVPKPNVEPEKLSTSEEELPAVVEEINTMSSLKGDRMDRLSPNIFLRRSSSPMPFDRNETSPAPHDTATRNRSPSLVDNMYLSPMPRSRSSSPCPMARERSPSPSPMARERSPSPSPMAKERSPSPCPMAKERSPSPSAMARERSPSPSRYSVSSADNSRRGSYENINTDMVHGSSEFMLVILEDQDNVTREYDMFEDNIIPPPMSLSAPELGADSPLFAQLKTSASSTELLHERAFARFIKEEEEINKGKHSDQISVVRRTSFGRKHNHSIQDRQNVPTILINSNEDDETPIFGKISSFQRRLSAGISNMAQQYLWAKRRNSLRNSDENDDLPELNLNSSGNTENFAKRENLSTEGEQDVYKIETKINIDNSSNVSNSIEKVENKRFSPEESIEESDSEEESEDERYNYDLSPPIIAPQEEEMYHPRAMIPKTASKMVEPFEILSKPSPLPDPNFVPKPILKRSRKQADIQKKSSPEKPIRKSLQNISEMEPPPLRSIEKDRSRSPSPSPGTSKVRPLTPIPSIPETQMISAAEAARKKRMLNRQSSEEEYKVAADYYADLVRQYGVQKRQQTPLFLNRDELLAATQEAEKEVTIVRNASPVLPPSKPVQVAVKEPAPFTPYKRSASPVLPSYKPVQVAVKEPAPYTPYKRNASPVLPPSKPVQLAVKEPAPYTPYKRTASPMPTSRRLLPVDNKPATPEPKPKQLRSRDSSRTRNAKRILPPVDVQNKIQLISRTPSPRFLTVEQEVLQADAEVKIRTNLDYLTDLAMFVLACWIYLFKDARFAIPILIMMVYRQVKHEVSNMLPSWLTKQKKH